jgi:hypothetical protein
MKNKKRNRGKSKEEKSTHIGHEFGHNKRENHGDPHHQHHGILQVTGKIEWHPFLEISGFIYWFELWKRSNKIT